METPNTTGTTWSVNFEGKFSASNDTFTKEKLETLKACQLDLVVPITEKEPFPAQLLHVARILKLNDEELYFFEAKDKSYENMISPHNEMQALKITKEVRRSTLYLTNYRYCWMTLGNLP